MKNKIVSIFCIFLSLQVFSQNPTLWHDAWGPNYRHLNGVEILANNKFIAVGGWPSNDSIATILVSNDTAASWNFVMDAIDGWLMDVDFPSETTGYVVGTAGSILKSVDEGDSWTQSVLPGNVESRDYNGCHFFDADNGIVVGGWHSNDSVQTILKTSNGGENWTVIQDILAPWLRAVHFIDNSIGFTVGDDGTILKTNDGGDNWYALPVSGAIASRQFNDVHFVDANVGVAIGGWSENDSIQTIIRTTNGGENWSIITDNIGSMLNAVDFYNATDGYAVGDDGVIYFTNDAGATWSEQIIPNNNQWGIQDVFFRDEHFGFTAGDEGKLLWYVDPSGTTLDSETSFSQTSIFNNLVLFPNPTHGQITLQFDQNPQNKIIVRVCDIMGKTIHSSSNYLNSNLLNIDISGFPQQLYFINVVSGDMSSTYKTILK